jgi:hypothetical protein
MLNWRELTLRNKITGMIILLLFILGGLAGFIAAQREAPFGTAQGTYTAMSFLGMVGILLSALLDPRSFRANPFRFIPGERSPRICMVLGVGGLILMFAGSILTKFG